MISFADLKKFNIKKNVSLKKLTTLKIGGPAKYFIEVKTEKKLIDILTYLEPINLLTYIIGDGSNLVPPDKGFDGLIIKVAIGGVEVSGTKVSVGAGANLLKLIHTLNSRGLSGMERMAGIPGTIAGAIYGNAGAYGQEIKDNIVGARFFDGKKVRKVSKRQLHLFYRISIFKKHKNWVVLSADFEFKKGNPAQLKKTSREIIALREKKYKPGLRCPGSFFKNIVLDQLPARQRAGLIKKLPKDKIMYGKIPAGYILEEVGAKGMKKGGIRIAQHHANLFYNAGGGKAADIKYLDRLLKTKVKRKFGITLEEEVQYL